MVLTACLILIAYLSGSIATAILVCRAMGLPDPRAGGSRNPGATNVLRLGGKKAAALTLIGDLLKGLLPVLLARWLGLEPTGLALVALAAFLGHLYPVFFGFVGGKGVATALGGMLGLSWPTALAALAVWLFVAFVLRISSLAALVAAALAPLFAWWFGVRGISWLILVGMVGLLIWRHRANIRNLLAGREGRIGADRSGG